MLVSESIRIRELLKGRFSLSSIVFYASEINDLSTLKWVREKHGEKILLQESDPNILSALHVAASLGSKDVVEYLLLSENGANPSVARVNNFTPLHGAAMQGQAAICQLLIDRGATVNVQTTPQLYTPLHSAAFGGHVDVLKLLLINGANRELKNYRDERAVDTAKRQNQEAAIRVLE